MPQTSTGDKPVTLSKHKLKIIAHGEPLCSSGSVDPYVPRPVIKDSSIEEKHGDTESIKSPPQVRSESFSEYQKSAQENLISINNNLSGMLQETFSGINSICQKVRLCLMETNSIKASGNTPTLSRMGTCEQRNIDEEKNHSDEVLSIEQVKQDQINGELYTESNKDKKSKEHFAHITKKLAKCI